MSDTITLEDLVGRRVIVIHFTHNRPDIETVLGTVKEINDKGIDLKDTMELSPMGHEFILPSHQKYWTGTWIPFDGHAKILTIIDKETEEIIYTKEWNKWMVDLFFGYWLGKRKDKFRQDYYGKPWSEIPKIGFRGEKDDS